MHHHTDPANQNALGAINTKGSEVVSTNDFNFATEARRSKAIAAQVAEFALRGHTFHAVDFAALQTFARRLGMSE